MGELDPVLARYVELSGLKKNLDAELDIVQEDILRMMRSARWHDYTDETTGNHVSLVDEQVEELDRTQLAFFVKSSDIPKLFRYRTDQRIVVTTRNSRNRFNRLLRKGRL